MFKNIKRALIISGQFVIAIVVILIIAMVKARLFGRSDDTEIVQKKQPEINPRLVNGAIDDSTKYGDSMYIWREDIDTVYKVEK